MGEILGTEGAARRAAGPGGAAEAGAGWRQWLAGGSPREILARIVQGDPLRLRERVAARLSEQALLLDADRVHLRSLARCARAAPRYRGRPEIGQWLDALVADSVTELLSEDGEDQRTAGPEPEAGGRAFVELAAPLGLEPAAMRAACRAFNRLADTERRTFFDLVLARRSLDELARAERGSASEVARRARRALDAVLQAEAAHGGASSPARRGSEEATS